MASSPKTTQTKRQCFICGKEYAESNFYSSHSDFFSNVGKLPYCKNCIEELYQHYYEKYKNENSLTPEKKAIKRLCMAFDIYYGDDLFDVAIKTLEKKKKKGAKITIVASYMQNVHLIQYKNKSYDTTILYEEQNSVGEVPTDITVDIDVDESVITFFGNGFSNDDYKFLKREYDDWVARHECKTKAQEEVFKRLCFKQLEILKATRRQEDTKDLDATFQKLLETAKLQPRQNSGDTMADTQTFGTLIDKWENTRPLPEIDPELRDVDKICLYIDVFFKGHLAKMMGLKNGLSNLYTNFMKKYTVEKPEYDDDENSEVLFDAIFGNASSDSDDEQEV